MDKIVRKNDAAEIRDFLVQLPQLSGLAQDRLWWTQFAFHFTDIRNAVQILESGWLYSRQRLTELGLDFVDGASPDIIDRTRQEELNYVRLYFRPLTPTQFKNEGIRPKNQRELGAHMPVPVFLLFELAEILTWAECRFSSSSLARTRFDIGDDCEFLQQLPFQDIYHHKALPNDPERYDEIKARRHAEIMIPQQFEIRNLREIHCRSAAEKDTLLNLLDEDARDRWKDRIYSDSRRHLFIKWWSYVESVFLGKMNMLIRFSPDTRTPGPFDIRVEFRPSDGKSAVLFSQEAVMLNELQNYSKRLRLPRPTSAYTCSVFLDEILCYAGRFVDYEMPF